jgi:hypothetical protein
MRCDLFSKGVHIVDVAWYEIDQNIQELWGDDPKSADPLGSEG